ncbi:MAG: NAD(P)H-hydrate epimerase [Tissierellaceae bacterium]
MIRCKEMRAIDRYAIENIGIPSIVLMENAALRVISNIDFDKNHSFTIVCGTGNNGGDGLAIARHLIIKGKKVDLYIIGNIDKGSQDFKINLNILKNIDVHLTHIRTKTELQMLKNSLNENDLTIDAIFGIGLAKDIQGLYFESISFINNYSKEIISVDIPSGLQCDTGDILSIAVKADKTITFHGMKVGLLDRKVYTGRIIVEDIGIPKKVTDIILKNI